MGLDYRIPPQMMRNALLWRVIVTQHTLLIILILSVSVAHSGVLIG